MTNRVNMKLCQGLSLFSALAGLGFQLLVLFSPSTMPSPSTLLSFETKDFFFFFPFLILDAEELCQFELAKR